MGAVGLLRRRSWRTGRLAWWSVAALTVLLTAVALASVAGARRTLDTYPEVLARHDSADVQLGMGNPDDADALNDVDVLSLAGVETAGVERFHLAGLVDHEGLLDPSSPISVATPADDAIRRDVERPLLLEGRMPAAHELDAVAVTKTLADQLDVGVGDRFRFGLVTVDEMDDVMAGDLSVGARPDVEVVGVVQPTDFSGDPDAPFSTSAVLASAAFADAHPNTSTFQLGFLRLTEGAAGVSTLARSLEALTGTGPDLGIRADTIDEVERAVRPEAMALALLGLLTALGGIMVVGQALSRQLAADREQNQVLAALGLHRRGRTVVRFVSALAVLVPGVFVGAAVAVAASPLAPIGLVRELEPSPGMRLDVAVHVGGAVLLLMVLVGLAGALAWRHSTLAAPAAPARSARLARGLAVMPPPWNVAASLASIPGSTRRQVRSLAGGLGAAVAVLAAVGTFTASSDRLQSTPGLYGHRYDLAVWDGYGAIPDDVIAETLAAEPAVADFGGVASTTGAVGGQEAELLGVALPRLAGTIVDGRVPAAADEVVLGLRLAARLGVGVGDEVDLTVGQAAGAARVVGVGALPTAKENGAALTLDGLRRLAPGAEVGWQYAELLDGAAPGHVQRRISASLNDCVTDCDVATPAPPVTIAQLSRTGSMPVLLGSVAAIAGLVAGVQGVVSLVGRNRSAVALLRALGATGHQAARVPVAQTVYAAGAAVVIGLPVGLVAGRLMWAAMAERLGVVVSHATPVGMLTGTIAATVAAGYLAGRVASRRTAGRPISSELTAE